MKLTPGLEKRHKEKYQGEVRFTKKFRIKSGQKKKKNRMNLLNEFVRHGVFPHDRSHWPY